MNNFLEIKSLRAWYGASQALFDVNLEIKEGEIVALLGRNGMGKSTTIKSICGLMNNFEGEINFSNISPWWIRGWEIIISQKLSP